MNKQTIIIVVALILVAGYSWTVSNKVANLNSEINSIVASSTSPFYGKAEINSFANQIIQIDTQLDTRLKVVEAKK